MELWHPLGELVKLLKQRVSTGESMGGCQRRKYRENSTGKVAKLKTR